MGVNTYITPPCQQPSETNFPCSSPGVALGGSQPDPGLICSSGLIGVLEKQGGVALGGTGSQPKHLGPTEGQGGLALGGKGEIYSLLTSRGGVSLGGLVDRYGVKEGLGGVALGGPGSQPGKLGPRVSQGGVALGGPSETKGWSSPRNDSGNLNVLGAAPSSFTIVAAAGDIIFLWLATGDPAGANSSSASVTTSGYTAITSNVSQGTCRIWCWWGQFGTAQTTVSVSFSGTATEWYCGYMSFGGAPAVGSNTSSANAAGNSSTPAVNSPGANSTAINVRCVAEVNNHGEQNGNWFSGWSGNYGLGAGYSGYCVGAYAITGYTGDALAQAPMLGSSNWAAVAATFALVIT
jgi:hypothetical protein